RSIRSSLQRTTATRDTLSLHDALPIYEAGLSAKERRPVRCGRGADGILRPVRRARRRRAAGGHHRARRPGASVDALLDEPAVQRSEEHTSELQSRENLVCRLLLEKKNR